MSLNDHLLLEPDSDDDIVAVVDIVIAVAASAEPVAGLDHSNKSLHTFLLGSAVRGHLSWLQPILRPSRPHYPAFRDLAMHVKLSTGS